MSKIVYLDTGFEHLRESMETQGFKVYTKDQYVKGIGFIEAHVSATSKTYYQGNGLVATDQNTTTNPLKSAPTAQSKQS